MCVCVCHAAGANGKSVTYNTSCTSNLFAWNTQQQSASSNKEGMSADQPVSPTYPQLSTTMWSHRTRFCTPTRAALVHYPWSRTTLLIQQVCHILRCFLKGSEQTLHLGCISQHIGLRACQCSSSTANYDGRLHHILLQNLTALVWISAYHKCLAVLQLMSAMQQDGSMCEGGDVMCV